MSKRKKPFDCVDLQHEGGARVSAMVKGMTIEGKVAYWAKRTKAARREQAAIRARKAKAAGGQSAQRRPA